MKFNNNSPAAPNSHADQLPSHDDPVRSTTPPEQPQPPEHSSQTQADPRNAEAFVPGLEPPPLDWNAVLRVSSDSAGPKAPVPEIRSGWLGPREPLSDDLRVPWGWADLVFLVLFWIGGTLVVTIALVILFQSRGISWMRLQQSPRELSVFMIADQVAISLFLMIYLAVRMRLRFDAPFWTTLGWRDLEGAAGSERRAAAYLRCVVLGFVLSALVQVASALFPAKTKLPIENFFQDRQSALMLMIMSVLLAPLVEETIFRGFIYPVVARSFGVAASVVGTGVLFGLLHAEQLKGGLWQIALMVVVGIIFTWVRAAKRTVLASYLLHLSYNSFLFAAFLVSSQGWRSLPH